MNHGNKTESQTETLTPADGDTVVVYRPAYKRHELWVYESGMVKGWQYAGQGTETEMETLGFQFS